MLELTIGRETLVDSRLAELGECGCVVFTTPVDRNETPRLQVENVPTDGPALDVEIGIVCEVGVRTATFSV
jgi:hypothetical protein